MQKNLFKKKHLINYVVMLVQVNALSVIINSLNLKQAAVSA